MCHCTPNNGNDECIWCYWQYGLDAQKIKNGNFTKNTAYLADFDAFDKLPQLSKDELDEKYRKYYDPKELFGDWADSRFFTEEVIKRSYRTLDDCLAEYFHFQYNEVPSLDAFFDRGFKSDQFRIISQAGNSVNLYIDNGKHFMTYDRSIGVVYKHWREEGYEPHLR